MSETKYNTWALCLAYNVGCTTVLFAHGLATLPYLALTTVVYVAVCFAVELPVFSK